MQAQKQQVLNRFGMRVGRTCFSANFDEFVRWFNEKDYDVELSADKNLAEIEAYLYNDKQQLKGVKEEIEKKKKQVVLDNEKLISNIIQENIVAHYFYKPGKIEASLSHDKDLIKAKEILKDELAYKLVLTNQ